MQENIFNIGTAKENDMICLGFEGKCLDIFSFKIICDRCWLADWEMKSQRIYAINDRL